MTLQEIKEKKCIGDYQVAAGMLGLSRANVRMILGRPGAKRHAAVVEAMGKVIAARERLLGVGSKKKKTEKPY